MKKILFFTAIVLAALAVSGCATVYSTPASINDLGDANVTRVAQETNIVYFSIFGEKETFPPAARVAQANGITRIATVERYTKPGLFGIWIEYTTIVSGQ